MSAPAKVWELDYTVAVQKIFGFDVSMDYFLWMKVLDSSDDLDNISCRFSIIEPLLGWFDHFLKNVHTWSKLENKVDLFVVPEESVQATNIFVFEMTLDFNLCAKLTLNLGFDELLFVKDFECDNEFWFCLSCKVYMAEFATTHRSTNFKVFNRPLTRIKLCNRSSQNWRRNILLILWILELVGMLILRLLSHCSKGVEGLGVWLWRGKSSHFWHGHHVSIWPRHILILSSDTHFNIHLIWFQALTPLIVERHTLTNLLQLVRLSKIMCSLSFRSRN